MRIRSLIDNPKRLAFLQFAIPPAILLIGIAICAILYLIEPYWAGWILGFFFLCLMECLLFIALALVMFVIRSSARHCIWLYLAVVYSFVIPWILDVISDH
ncbi:MAG TPA: hypothetical protein VGZ47_10820 [Gemmataceae bacterium]|jgi:hypothetical protein|nr:hypothetical protein [Gemmataceae bacterium]